MVPGVFFFMSSIRHRSNLKTHVMLGRCASGKYRRPTTRGQHTHTHTHTLVFTTKAGKPLVGWSVTWSLACCDITNDVTNVRNLSAQNKAQGSGRLGGTNRNLGLWEEAGSDKKRSGLSLAEALLRWCSVVWSGERRRCTPRTQSLIIINTLSR